MQLLAFSFALTVGERKKNGSIKTNHKIVSRIPTRSPLTDRLETFRSTYDKDFTRTLTPSLHNCINLKTHLCLLVLESSSTTSDKLLAIAGKVSLVSWQNENKN